MKLYSISLIYIHLPIKLFNWASDSSLCEVIDSVDVATNTACSLGLVDWPGSAITEKCHKKF